MGITITQYRVSIGVFCGGTLRQTSYKEILDLYFLYSGFDLPNILTSKHMSSKYFKLMTAQRNSVLSDPKKYNMCLLVGFSIMLNLSLCLLCCGDVHPNPGPPGISDITICHANVRSIRYSTQKLDYIKCTFADQFNIITLSETWLNNSISNKNLCLPGFQIPFRRDRPDNSGYGGILVWVSSELAVKPRPDLEIPEIEGLWLEIRACNVKFLLGTFYRPPNADASFWEHLQEALNLVKSDRVNNVILTGDFNADPQTPDGNRLKTFTSINHLRIHVNEPTRYDNNSARILDQFITNIPNFVKTISILPPVLNSDHCTISLKLKFKMKKVPAYQRLMWNFSNVNFNLFSESVQNIDFSFCDNITNINAACEHWSNEFMSMAKVSVPNKMVVVRPNDKPWFTNVHRRLLRRKNKVHKQAKSRNTPELWEKFREIRNSYNREISMAKAAYENNKYIDLINMGKENPKKWWSILKNILGQTNESDIPPIKIGDTIITDNKEKADAFNQFFVESSTLNDDNVNLPNQENIDGLDNILVSENDVLDQLANLDINKAYGPDGIPPKLLKEARKEICSSVTKLLNASLRLQKFPDIWKRANVLPLFKKDDDTIRTNYRPVSLLCTLSKVFERIVFKYVFNYFRDNFIITLFQFGFLPGHSTTTQLIEMYHYFCKEVSDGKEIRVVFLDISKAFDRVWHGGLCHKLQKCGIRGNLLSWFSDYLSDRAQRVVIKGQYSEWLTLNAGVPQGSVLGPLLFLVFINDLAYVVRHCQIRMFADDTCLFISVDNREDAANLLNQDLAGIQHWSEQWLVTFSPSKTESMIVSNKTNIDNHPTVYLNNTPIKEVKFHKHLGITLSHNLRWSKHIDVLSTACHKKTQSNEKSQV